MYNKQFFLEVLLIAFDQDLITLKWLKYQIHVVASRSHKKLQNFPQYSSKYSGQHSFMMTAL